MVSLKIFNGGADLLCTIAGRTVGLHLLSDLFSEHCNVNMGEWIKVHVLVNGQLPS